MSDIIRTMKNVPRTLSIIAMVVGIVLVFYGFANTVVTNEQEVLDLYDCGRSTLELRDTDIYCEDPSIAPGSSQSPNFGMIFSGIILTGVGGFLIGRFSGDLDTPALKEEIND